MSRTRRRGSLILAVNASGIGLNVIAGDQYVADVLPARMFRGEFARRGLAPQVLSRAVEDSGTVTSVLVPWNTCGAYISGVLGVSTGAYLPFCFFNILSPILDVAVRLHRVQGARGRPSRGATDSHAPATQRRHRSDHRKETPDEPARRPRPAGEASRFTLPSAYTILFALIVADGDRHLDHPGRHVQARQGRRAGAGDVPRGAERTRSAS